ncbi:hypothetical protein [Streptomyces sp. NPDC048606]|uniref:hypothetical protein n=1 Tax=Streptomyces sp. NPDC048606 TaxID=3154726 RepID=UPI00341221CF
MTTPETPPFLSLHTTVVLLIAFVIGTVLGLLTALGGAPVALGIVTGITSAGAAIPALRSLIK